MSTSSKTGIINRTLGAASVSLSVDRTKIEFTKVVDAYDSTYPTLQAAFNAAIAGDSILVTRGYAISAVETCSVNNVLVQFLPNVVIDASGISGDYALRLSGNYCHVIRPVYLFNGNTALGGIRISGSDNEVTGASIKMIGSTLTNGYIVDAGAFRNYLIGSVNRSSGTLTNLLTNSGTDTDASVRGG
jgi:hypothetical protein